MRVTHSIPVALLLIATACGGGGSDAGSEADEPERRTTGKSEQILIKGYDELRFEPAELTVRAGEHTIVFQNVGTAIHQLAVAKEGDHMGHHLADTGEVAGKASKTIEVDLKKGNYEFACHVTGHYEAGMKGTLTVN